MDRVYVHRADILFRTPLTRTSSYVWQTAAGYPSYYTSTAFNGVAVSLYVLDGEGNFFPYGGEGGDVSVGGIVLYKGTNSGSANVNIARVAFTCGEGYYADVSPPEDLVLDCATVDNADFDSPAGWTGFGSIITGSVATLAGGDYVAQNVGLQPNMSYSGIISISRIISGIGNVEMEVSLGEQSQSVVLAPTGQYTISSLMTPYNLAGPIQFKIENITGGEFDVDYACLYLDQFGGQRNCIAPLNGEFDTADNWYWYRSASWNAPSKSALLPWVSGSDADRSLIVAAETYTMPSILDGQYLLLGFQAETQRDQMAILSSNTGAVEHFYEVYAGPYEFEADISSAAGSTISVAFANSGAVEGDFLAEDNILLDNICIFVSNNPPSLPGPRDYNDIIPADFGFNYGCADTSAVLSGYGINMFEQQDIYEAGVSVWDPEQYIPWLAAAFWMHAGRPIVCMLLEFMRLVVGMTEQLINVFVNYVEWMMRTTYAGSVWLQNGFVYLAGGGASATRPTAYGWLNWFGSTARQTARNWSSLGGLLFWLPDRFRYDFHLAVNLFIGDIWNSNLVEYLQFNMGSQQLPVSANPLPVGGGFFESFLGSYDMVTAMSSLVWYTFDWLWTNVLGIVNLPLDLYSSFLAGSGSEAFGSLVSCSDDFWCAFLAGVEIVNRTVAHSILYPIVIVTIVIVTLVLIWKNIQKMATLEIK